MTPPFVLCLLVAAAPDSAVVDKLAADALAAWGVPGVGVVVVAKDRPAVVNGYGLVAAGRPDPVTADTVFPLASCTKAFTTTLTAMLVDDGRLGWDDPVRTHLPAFHLSDPHADALVTLRDLFAHRTGVPGHDLLWYRAPWDTAESLRRIPKLPVEKPFRASYEYSTLMVMAAGQAVAGRAGQPWDELVRDRLFGPLGMTGATTGTPDPKARAVGHRLTNGKPAAVPWYETKEPNPAGSIALRVRDAEPWLRLHLADGEFAGKRLVSAESLRETRTPQTLLRMDPPLRRQHPDTVQMAYALGWLVYDYRGHRVAAHGGMIDGFRTQLTLLPDAGVGVALFNNLHDTRMNQALTNALVDHLLGLPAKDWNALLLAAAKADADEHRAGQEALARARRPLLRPSLPADRYAGRYDHPAYGTATVTAADDKLTLEWSSFRVPLTHWEGDVYRAAGGVIDGHFVEFRVTPTGPDALRFLEQVFARK